MVATLSSCRHRNFFHSLQSDYFDTTSQNRVQKRNGQLDMNIITFSLKIRIFFDFYGDINVSSCSTISAIITYSLITQFFVWLNTAWNTKFNSFFLSHELFSTTLSTFFFNYLSFSLTTRTGNLSADCS